MPLVSDSDLAENIYVELPESFEVPTLPRGSFSCQRKNNFENFGDMPVEEKPEEDAVKMNWRDAFNGKWPYLAPLFFKSEEETLSKLQEQTRNLENAFNNSVTSLNSSQWEGSIQDIWSGSQRNVNEAFEIESSGQIDDDIKPRRCEKSCRRFLCAFLGFSILGAILAGVGLSLLLTSYTRDKSLLRRQDVYVNSDLSSPEQKYLTETFCDLIEVLLKGAEFPTSTGLESCQAYMKLIENTEAVHIGLRISPQTGFTIKEKLRRALKEEILVEGAYRLKGSDKCIYVGESSNQIRCGEIGENKSDRIALSGSAGLNEIEPSSPIPTTVLEAEENIQIRNVFEMKKSNPYRSHSISDVNKDIPSHVSPQTPIIEGTTGSNLMKTVKSSPLIQPSSTYKTLEKKISPSSWLEPSSDIGFQTSISSVSYNTQSLDQLQRPLQLTVSKDIFSTRSISTDLWSDVYSDRPSVTVPSLLRNSKVTWKTVSDMPYLDITKSSDWFYMSSSSVDSQTSKGGEAFEPQLLDVVTKYAKFETQTKNNTVGTTALILDTSPVDTIQTIENINVKPVSSARIDISNQITDAVINSLRDQTTSTSHTLQEVDTKNEKTKSATKTITDSFTNNDTIKILQDIQKELKALNEIDQMWSFNLYGPSGSKNYLRFPIVTGSNGKFLFSPLSNKDSINIKMQKGHESLSIENQTSTRQLMPHGTMKETNLPNIEADRDNKVQTINQGPKPMMIDWKTPPAVKPTNFPTWWATGYNKSMSDAQNIGPAGSKVIFSIPNS